MRCAAARCPTGSYRADEDKGLCRPIAETGHGCGAGSRVESAVIYGRELEKNSGTNPFGSLCTAEFGDGSFFTGNLSVVSDDDPLAGGNPRCMLPHPWCKDSGMLGYGGGPMMDSCCQKFECVTGCTCKDGFERVGAAECASPAPTPAPTAPTAAPTSRGECPAGSYRADEAGEQCRPITETGHDCGAGTAVWSAVVVGRDYREATGPDPDGIGSWCTAEFGDGSFFTGGRRVLSYYDDPEARKNPRCRSPHPWCRHRGLFGYDYDGSEMDDYMMDECCQKFKCVAGCTCKPGFRRLDATECERIPTQAPTTRFPTPAPTKYPTTQNPTPAPTKYPTTQNPTPAPTKYPTTQRPTPAPTKYPTTQNPTPAPTKYPATQSPTPTPTHPAQPVAGSCVDMLGPGGVAWRDGSGDGCDWYAGTQPAFLCGDGFPASCCVSRGADTANRNYGSLPAEASERAFRARGLCDWLCEIGV